MKKQNNQRRQHFLLAAIATIIMLGASASAFAQGIGAKYGSRDPQTCADTKTPARGAISAALATKYVICAQDGEQSSQLYLVENVKVTVGGGRPYNSFSDSYATSIDTTAPVYPIRGSLDKYQCDKVSAYMDNAKRNCTLYHEPKAEGKCYKTTFGDWYCSMHDLSNNQSNIEYNMKPPGGGAAVPDEDKPAAKNDNQTAETKADANDDKDENGFPKPDFSEMEKYFDISKSEYDPTDGKLYFIGKMTKKNNAVDWVINFYDADGIKLIDTNGITVVNGDYYQVGDTAKYYFYLPPQSLRKRISKVVITKRVY
ncbi:MAG: hypothetical protein ACR2N3_05580 [Pyrinomonadaceae bacterium]